jgi:phosphatidylserine/phosphatidylglycerophosphate/cardiolipin synthase-like enzyme
MRQKQWFLSVLLFSVSILFLLFSKNFFRQPPAPQNQLALPSISVPQADLVLLANKDYYPVLKQHFQQAHKSILGTVYLFKTTSYRDNEPSDLLRELIAARKRNVDVDLVMDLSDEDRESKETNIRTGLMLQKAGIKVRYDTVDIITHSKAFVIDDRYCFVGSHNLTHSAMSMNEELSLFIDSPEMAHKITDFIRQIPLSSEPLREEKKVSKEAPAGSGE